MSISGAVDSLLRLCPPVQLCVRFSCQLRPLSEKRSSPRHDRSEAVHGGGTNMNGRVAVCGHSRC